jgi:hypothetical protein
LTSDTSFKKEVKATGWNWHNAPETSFTGSSTLPENIEQYDEKKVGYEVAQKNIDAVL